MSAALLAQMRDLIQEDVGGRGLAHDPADNLLTACPDDFAAACRGIAATPKPSLAVVTGFYIAAADPPCAETDGPLGAVFLARALTPLGVQITLVTDALCRQALEVGLDACGLRGTVPVVTLPPGSELDGGPFTHLVAVERVGPGYDSRCRNMRGRDITDHTAPAHLLFEGAARRTPAPTTIGIGDGGNEIGMGKVPRDVIGRNIPRGDLIACRVATDHLIVAGVSNWGAYALAAGVALLRGGRLDPALFDADRERELLRVMVEQGPLVDGVTARPALAVDGLPFEEYVKPLCRLGQLLGGYT
jgi:hypothetical protein